MKDLQARIEKLLTEAGECDVIASSAMDVKKRELFERLARDFREMAKDVQKIIDIRGAVSN